MDDGEEGMRMTPRERILATLGHREPDRVPLTARLWLDTRLKLRQYYGVTTDEALFQRMGVDNPVVNVSRLMPRSWKPTKEYVEFCEATGYEPESEYPNFEEWGVQRRLGVKSGSVLRQYFFARHPWESFTKVSEVEDVVVPSLAEERFERAASIVEARKDSYLVVGALGHVLWTKGWELRGMLTFMKDLHMNPEMAEAILEKLVEYGCELADRLLDLGCDGIQLSEDWGNNHSLFISPALWRRYFKPRYRRVFDRAKRRGKLVFFHSDGNITPIVGDLVEIGVDSLNPVQPECMDQLEVKRMYGGRVTIDTGVSNQRTLPFGSVADVRREVLYALGNLAPGGGFVYGTSHYAMYEVPVENVVALYETCRRYGAYPIGVPG